MLRMLRIILTYIMSSANLTGMVKDSNVYKKKKKKKDNKQWFDNKCRESRKK